MKNASIVICGAGIAGIATAYYLAVKYRQQNIVLIDKYQPMSLTTSKSGENFRAYWPQPCMTALTSHSIDLMQSLAAEQAHAFELRYSGYDFVSESQGREIFPSEHFRHADSADKLLRVRGKDRIASSHPYLADSIQQLVRFKRAGAFDVHGLGSLLLGKAKRAGVTFLQKPLDAIEHAPAGFRLVLSAGGDRQLLDTEKLVLTPGPFINKLAAMVGVSVPVETILQRKFVIPDPQHTIPRDMPFTIFSDPQYLWWDDQERMLIGESPEYAWLLDEFPAGLHIKPEGNGHIKLGWAFNREPETPRWETPDDFDFPNITLRGARRFIPALTPYVDQPPTPIIQFSGYYTRTRENLPLIGPLHPKGLFTVSALSGFGTMAACSAGELCADWMMAADLPGYARYFNPDRYDDVALMDEIGLVGSDGQL